MLPFVGRARELELLRSRLADAQGGRGQVVLLTGEPGIGKSRLAVEFVRGAEQDGVPVAWGRASEDEGSPPYWIFRQVLRPLGLPMPELLDRGATQGPGEAGAGSASAEARFAAFEAVAEQLRATAEARGLVVVLDDLHWAEAASLALLVHLARGLGRSRVMVVATYRDTEATGREALSATLAALAHESGLSRVRLVGLTSGEVAEQLAAVTGSAVPAELASRISRRTGGNPFFVGELGRLVDQPDGALPDAVLPDAVLDAVRARLGRLGDSCRELVATAAALGSELDTAALGAVLERPVAEVLADIDAATESGLLHATEPRRFSHDLVRESARTGLSTARRLDAHARAAAWLEAQPDSGARVAEIAYHWLESLPVGDAGRACAWAERAADEALDQLAWEDAADLYVRALSAASALPPGERSRLLRGRGVALLRGGDLRSGQEALQAAADAARAAGDPVALAEAALAIEGLSDPFGSLVGGGLAREALDALPEQDSALRARLLALQAGEGGYVADTEYDRISADALAMAERLGDATALRSALRARQMVRAGPDGVGERLELADRMLGLGHAESDDDAILWGHLWRFDALLMLGRLDEAEAELGPIARHAERLRRPVARWHYLRSVAAIDISRGRFAAAIAATRESIAVAAERAFALKGVPISVLMAIASTTGQDDLVGEDAFEYYHQHAPSFTFSVPALYWLRRGDLEQARRYYLSAGRVDDLPVPARLAMTCIFVELAVALDDAAAVERCVAILRPHAELVATGGAGALFSAGSVGTYLGMALAATGGLDDAVRELRSGIAANERAGTPPFTAYAQFELAKVLARRRRPGDLDEAAALAASAAATAEALGMAPLGRAASALLATLSGDTPGPLTRRECEVAQQVAQGLTNRQVAALLHISERTVETHVQHVLTKLHLNNRTQLAGWARRELRTGST